MHRKSNSSEVDVVLQEALSLAEETKKRDVSSELGGRVSASMKIDTSPRQPDKKDNKMPKDATNAIMHSDYRKTLETKKVENTTDPARRSAEYVRGVGVLLGTMRLQAGAPK